LIGFDEGQAEAVDDVPLDMREIEERLVIKMGIFIFVAIGVVTVLVKLL